MDPIQASHDLVECFLSLCRRRKFRLQLDDYCCEGPSANEQIRDSPEFLLKPHVVLEAHTGVDFGARQE
jgi:hypothetical protein